MSSTLTEALERKPRNIAVNTNPQHRLHLVQSYVPKPGLKERRVHVCATGICGSDVHFWRHGKIGDVIVVGKNGLGHEGAGIVIMTGSDVTRIKPGM